jgi:hypothetical protein
MYQMLTNLASNSPTQPNPSLRFRSLTDQQSPIINHQKPLKRLGPKRNRLVKTNSPSESFFDKIYIIMRITHLDYFRVIKKRKDDE